MGPPLFDPQGVSYIRPRALNAANTQLPEVDYENSAASNDVSGCTCECPNL
jgi:hypothetical protein